MSKRRVPPLRPRDRIVPIVESVRALNKKMTVTITDTLIVVAKRFDRKLKEWVIWVAGGGKFLAKFFRRLAKPEMVRHAPNRYFRRPVTA